MTDAQIEAGTLEASLDDRTVTGLLLPWEEVGNSNLGKFAIAKDAVTIPRDPSVVSLNLGHNHMEPVGRATALTPTDAGVVATFRIADTDEGDQYLLDVTEGKRNRLSAEVKHLVLRAGKAVSGALFGAAAVEKGAFPSAALMAEDVGTLEAALSDEDQATVADLAAQITAIAETDSEAPAEEAQPTEELLAMANEATGAAMVPSTVKTPAARPRTTLRQVAHALAQFHADNDRSAINALAEKDGSTLFAALVDITTAGADIIQPQWVGDVWAERVYQRKIVPLLSQANLTSLKIQGFRFTTAPVGGEWTGDKTAVPSGPVDTEPVTETVIRWALGNDIAREYLDFAVAEFWTAYYQFGANDYARFSDEKTLDHILANSTAVAGGAVPSGINGATAALVDGAIAVLEAGGTPTFSVVAPDVYRDLLLQGNNDVIATLNLATGLEESSLAGFSIVADSAIPATTALVGDRAAATFYELPGVPIRTTSLDQVKGGVDEVAFGYFATLVNSLENIVHVTPTP